MTKKMSKTESTEKGTMSNVQVKNDFLMSIIRHSVALAGLDPNNEDHIQFVADRMYYAKQRIEAMM